MLNLSMDPTLCIIASEQLKFPYLAQQPGNAPHRLLTLPTATETSNSRLVAPMIDTSILPSLYCSSHLCGPICTLRNIVEVMSTHVVLASGSLTMRGVNSRSVCTNRVSLLPACSQPFVVLQEQCQEAPEMSTGCTTMSYLMARIRLCVTSWTWINALEP